MDLSEIRQYANFGRQGGLCVDIRPVAEYPGFVRCVIFQEETRVSISFNGYGQDEGGFRYCATFDSLDEAVVSIEGYTGISLSDWENYNRTGHYPEPGQSDDRSLGELCLVKDVIEGRVRLPEKGQFKLMNFLPWATFDEYLQELRK